MDAQSLIDTIGNKIESLRGEAEDALDRLEGFATLPFQTWVDFASTAGFDPKKVSPIDRESLPELKKPILPATTLLDPSAFERYKSHVFQAPQLEALQSKLAAFIDSGGTGISADVQQALFDKDRERRLQSLRDAMDLAGARTGARGFRYPNSMTKAAQNEILLQHQQDLNQLSREITTLMAELAQKNVQFAVSEQVKVETLHADFALRFAELFRGITAAQLDKFRAETSAYVAEYEAQTRYVLSQVEVARANASLEGEHQRLLLAKWDKEVSNSTLRTQSLMQQAEHATSVKLQAAQSLAQSYIGLMDAMQANAIVSVTGDSGE